MRRIFGSISFAAAATFHWWWEFVRGFVFYEPLSHFLRGRVVDLSIDTLVQIGASAAFAALGLWLIWPSRPEFLRRANLNLFLERDSQSELIGVQTFPGVSYVQISVTASKTMTGCRAFLTKSEFLQDGLFSLEHNERLPLPWSKHHGPNELEIEIKANEPPVRINVAVFNKSGIGIAGRGGGAGTPTNFYVPLQRSGLHRLEIHVAANSGNQETKKSCFLNLHWDDHTKGAWVEPLSIR